MQLAVAFGGAIQGIAQELVRIPNTPMPAAEWIMDIIRKEKNDEKRHFLNIGFLHNENNLLCVFH